MATPAGHLIQDQNLNIHSTGTLLGGKVDASRPTKKGVLGGRRALNDISNSGKSSAVQPSTKIKSRNAVPIGKNLGASKANSSKNQEKGKANGRKVLSDLTNTVKPSLQHLSTKSQDKKFSAIAEENVPSAIKEEAFLHNHEECLKGQRKTMSFDYFLETVGLTNGSSLVLRESLELKAESPVKPLEMEEMPMMLDEDEVDKIRQRQHAYPSSKATKDWDKLKAQMKKEEKDEKLDGDAGLNKFFPDIYRDADEDARRAMMKSFVESNGTVLSTNWKEVGGK